MPYITRNKKKQIIGVFTLKQYEGQEFVKEIPKSWIEREKKYGKIKMLKVELNNSDWIIMRHNDQHELGIKPTLSEKEYKKILADRQKWREEINELMK